MSDETEFDVAKTFITVNMPAVILLTLVFTLIP